MSKKRLTYFAAEILAGIVLLGLGIAGIVDEFWNGIGSSLAILGAVRLLRGYRLNKNEAYREKVEIAASDERNQFIRSKAWAWAGYLFIILTGISVIVFKLMGQDLLSQAASWGVCLMLVLYWGAYKVLQRKY